MCTCLGGNSSPGCFDNTLQKTTNDNEAIYGEEAPMTLLHNLYMDDLKSAKTKELAIRINKDVKVMYQAGDFKLTK